jgi:hypothetical protein
VCSRSVLKYTHEPGTTAWQIKFAILKFFGVRFFIDMKNHWVEASDKYEVEKRLRQYVKDNPFVPYKGAKVEALITRVPDIAIQAEVLGPSVGAAVHNVYKLQYTEMRIFDILVDGKYLPYDEMVKVVADLGLGHILVPLVYRGPVLPKDQMVAFSNGVSMLNPEALREGLVWKPATREIFHHNLGRVQLKAKSPEYAIKYGTE